MFSAHADIGDAGQFGHLTFSGGQIVDIEPRQMVMAAGAGHNLYQLDRRIEEILELDG